MTRILLGLILWCAVHTELISCFRSGNSIAKWRVNHSNRKDRMVTNIRATAAPPVADPLALPKVIQQINKQTVEAVKSILFQIYGERNYARFAALETIARVPYFSYTSVLHLYETLGWFRKKEYIQIHFAESWNELHHLLIMEELGGSDRFLDRFVAQHIAFFYYWLVVVLYIAAPAVAYDLNKHVECHAFETYDKFLKAHEDELKQQPAPQVAVEYYQSGDLYMFDAFQYHQTFKDSLLPLPSHHSGISESVINTATPSFYSSSAAMVVATAAVASAAKEEENRDSGEEAGREVLVEISEENSTPIRSSSLRRPKVESLYDVFANIRADEAEHAETMQILQRDMCLRSRGKEEK